MYKGGFLVGFLDHFTWNFRLVHINKRMKNFFVAVFFVMSCVFSAQLHWVYDPYHNYPYMTPPEREISDMTDGRTFHKSDRMIHHSLISGFILKSQASRIERLEIAIESLKQCACGAALANIATPISKMPYSCEDLQQMGHASSGLYSVLGAKQIETVYCDFTKPINAEGFETRIGSLDVKSVPTNFYVQKHARFSTMGTPIPFEIEVANTGRAMDLTSGKFTAPVKGTYVFSFTGHASFPSSFTMVENLGVDFYLNGNKIGSAEVGEFHSANNQLSPLTLQTTLNLQAEDQVWLQIGKLSDGVELYDDRRHFTHFSGFLLEEDFS